MKDKSAGSRCLRMAAVGFWLTGLTTIALGQAKVLDTAQDEPVPAAFSPAARRTLDHLKELNSLPVGLWRYHAGDIPHGEAVALDDSAWPTLTTGMNASAEATWYRLRVTMPTGVAGYSLRGARVLFQFKLRFHGPITQIVYFNGRRVALGEDLEPIELFRDARPGQSVLIAVKLPRTDDIKRYLPSVFTVEFDPSRPSPEVLRTELLTASALTPASNQALLDRAAETVNWSALERQPKVFDASLRRAEAMLEPLRATLKADTIDLIGNSHIDAAWLWPVSETMDVVKRTFTTSLQLMHEYPEYKYTQSAAAYYDWMQEKYPFQFAEIKERVAQKRWEVVGGMWVEPDLNMLDGESIARQLLVGTRWLKANVGADVTVGWNPDSFGYNRQLPQIYRRAGIDVFVTQKMKWNDTTQLPLKTFWWQAPDGSRVLTYFPHDYNRGTEPLRLANDLRIAKRLAPGTDTLMHLYGVGDHGGGPTRVMIDEALAWSKPQTIFPKQQFVFAQDFFEHLKTRVDPRARPVLWDYRTLATGLPPLPPAEAGKVSIPTWNDELYLEFHRGVYTSQSRHKQHMRQSEEWVLNAEKAAALAWLGGSAYPGQELTDDWKKVLFNQFHDLAAGSGNAATYKDAERDYAAVLASTKDVQDEAWKTIAAHIDTAAGKGEGTPVLVWNPMAWTRSEPVEVEVQLPQGGSTSGVVVLDPAGHAVPVQVLSADAGLGTFKLLVRPEVPSFGYTVLRVARGSKVAPSSLRATSTVLENQHLRVEVDAATGCITHLLARDTGFDAIANGGCGNELQAFQDRPTDYDAWNIDPGTLDKPPTLLHGVDSIELVESGPLKATIRVRRHWQSSTFVQDITLYDGADTVELANRIDWHERHILLKAAVPLAATSAMATYETAYGTTDRPTTRTNAIDGAKFEVPALRWADLGDGAHGLSLLNESKYGYDAAGNVLRLSLLRGSTYPDPEMDQGEHVFRFALYPHAGTWQQGSTMHRGYELNYKLQAWQVAAHAGTLPATLSFVRMDTPGVTLSAVKKAEDGDALILRVYEWAGKAQTVSLHLPEPATGAVAASLLETPQLQQVDTEGNNVSFPIKPFEILTVRVEMQHGSALWTARGDGK